MVELIKRLCTYCGSESTMFDSDKKCWSCMKKDANACISLDVKSCGESDREDNLFCPYCGFMDEDSEVRQDGVTYCSACNEKFSVTVEYDIKYSTYKI